MAAFGQKLRGGEYLDGFSYRQIAQLAAAARGDDADGYRSEFVSLVKLADSLAAVASPPGEAPEVPSDPAYRPQVRR